MCVCVCVCVCIVRYGARSCYVGSRYAGSTHRCLVGAQDLVRVQKSDANVASHGRPHAEGKVPQAFRPGIVTSPASNPRNRITSFPSHAPDHAALLCAQSFRPEMVSDGSLAYAKIDRPKGVINFAKRKPAEEVSIITSY